MLWTIAYDPALMLGSLVSKQRLDILQQITAAQMPVDTAQNLVNSLSATQRSLEMTSREVASMGIDTTEIDNASAALGKDIAAAAQRLTEVEAVAINAIKPLQAKMAGISEPAESPIDYTRTLIKQMPLPADGLRMNVQYFSAGQSHTSSIASFINDNVCMLGDEFALQVAASATCQVEPRIKEHSIAGTLVISVTCINKNAVQLAPFVVDVDKGISAFNAYFPDSRINTDSVESLAKVALSGNRVNQHRLMLVSGATLGSCFIGLVHVLNTSATHSDEALESIASSLQTQFTVGGWFERFSDGFGVRSSFTDDAKAIVSSHNVTSHCSFTTVGSTPALQTNQLKMGVDPLSHLDASSAFEETASDNAADKVIDFNSMIGALDEYLHNCVTGNIGVPVSYSLRAVDASKLAMEWLARHKPGTYSFAADDSSVGIANQSRDN